MACKMCKITALTWEISSWRLVEKFHISAFPCVILYIVLFYIFYIEHEMTNLEKICASIQEMDTKTSTKRHKWNEMTQNGLFDIFSNAHVQTPAICTSSHHNVPYETQQVLQKGSEPCMSVLATARAQLLNCSTLIHTWAYHMERIFRILLYIYRNW